MFTGPLFQMKLHLLSTTLLSGFQIVPGVGQYLINFKGLVGIVSSSIYKTESIFTGLWHGNLS